MGSSKLVIRVPFLCSTWVTLFPILTRSGSAIHKVVLSVQIFSHTSINGKTRSIRERQQVTHLQQSHFHRCTLHWEVSQSPTDFKEAWLLRDWQRKLRDCWIFSLCFLEVHLNFKSFLERRCRLLFPLLLNSLPQCAVCGKPLKGLVGKQGYQCRGNSYNFLHGSLYFEEI